VKQCVLDADSRECFTEVMIFSVLVIAALAAAAAGTVVLVVRDGYRRVPTRRA